MFPAWQATSCLALIPREAVVLRAPRLHHMQTAVLCWHQRSGTHQRLALEFVTILHHNEENTIALGSLFTHIQICRDASFPPQHLPSREIVCPSSSRKWKTIKDLFFPDKNINVFNVWEVCLLLQMLKRQLYVPDLDDVKLWRKECIFLRKIF